MSDTSSGWSTSDDDSSNEYSLKTKKEKLDGDKDAHKKHKKSKKKKKRKKKKKSKKSKREKKERAQSEEEEEMEGDDEECNGTNGGDEVLLRNISITVLIRVFWMGLINDWWLLRSGGEGKVVKLLMAKGC